MLFRELKIKDKEYKLRLNAKACVSLEKRLGTNPLNIFMGENSLPSMENLLIIFHESLQAYQHDIAMDDVYDIYDAYLEDGGNITKFVEIIIDIFKDAGFIPSEDETKNA